MAVNRVHGSLAIGRRIKLMNLSRKFSQTLTTLSMNFHDLPQHTERLMLWNLLLEASSEIDNFSISLGGFDHSLQRNKRISQMRTSRPTANSVYNEEQQKTKNNRVKCDIGS
nr:hypothetical transcript [Hymenolepis microstoma]